MDRAEPLAGSPALSIPLLRRETASAQAGGEEVGMGRLQPPPRHAPRRCEDPRGKGRGRVAFRGCP